MVADPDRDAAPPPRNGGNGRLGLGARVRNELGAQRATALILMAAIAVDLAFVAVHLLASWRASADTQLYMDVDRSYAEVFQYVKFVFIIVLITFAALERRRWSLLTWVPLFVVLLLDDVLILHERIGWEFVVAFDVPSVLGIAPSSLGELAVIAIAGAVLGAVIVVGMVFARPETRRIFVILGVLVVLLAVFGVAVDLAHAAVFSDAGGLDWLAIIEDGGEMIALTLIVAAAVRMNVSGGTPALARLDRDRTPATSPSPSPEDQ